MAYSALDNLIYGAQIRARKDGVTRYVYKYDSANGPRLTVGKEPPKSGEYWTVPSHGQPVKRSGNPRRSPSRRANSATFRSFEHLAMADRAYLHRTGWRFYANTRSRATAEKWAAMLDSKGDPGYPEMIPGSARVIEIRNPEIIYRVMLKVKKLPKQRALKPRGRYAVNGSRSSNPHAFHDARVKLTRKGEVKIAIHNPSSAAAFLKVMGRRKNGAVTGNPWDREQFISRAKDLEHAGYVRLGLNYTKAQAQKIIKAQRAKGNNARLMPYPSKTGGTKYGVWVQY